LPGKDAAECDAQQRREELLIKVIDVAGWGYWRLAEPLSARAIPVPGLLPPYTST
jgi:hypothetical protein